MKPTAGLVLLTTLMMALAAALPGCQTVRPHDEAGDSPVVVVTQEQQDGQPPKAPSELYMLMRVLLKYRATKHMFPKTLGELQEEGLIGGDGFPALDQYAYHRHGLGMLPANQKLLVADYEVRVPGHLWCIVQDAPKPGQGVALLIRLVSLDTLEQIATR